MTQHKQFLFINRLLVSSRGKYVYDQQFFSGINIIRGDNGTGKSTIMDLLFFALGGDVKDWTDEQSRCDFVMCEIDVPGKTLTLKREIKNSTSLYIYEGKLDPEAPANSFLVLPYRVSDRKESFSQVLFDYIGLPRYKKDDAITLTMHQILRLIYVDQITPPNKILKQESSTFDGHSNRLAIGEYLLGIDDLGSHILRQEKSKLEKQVEEIVVERKAIHRVLGKHLKILDEETLSAEIESLAAEKVSLQESVNSDRKGPPNESVNVIAQITVTKITNQKDTLVKLENRRNRLSDEIIDGELFIDSLNFRIRSIGEAAEISEGIGGMDFKFCPSCLTPISSSEDHGHCKLCKSPSVFDSRGRGYLAERTSLQFQLAESKEVVEKFREELSGVGYKIAEVSAELELLLNSYRPIGVRADDPQYYQDAVRLGFIEKQLEQLTENIGIVREIDLANQRLSDITLLIESIKSRLETTLARTAGRRDQVTENISALVVKILKEDLGYEMAFNDASHFDFSFGLDVMRLDGKSKFSASSMTLLKNSFRFAIFYLSVLDPEMRYPRLLIMDNIEDKGMVPQRSQAFQRTIVECCSHLTSAYQLIFTTSMIDPELNNSEFCRGRNYLKGDHTLEF